MNVSIRRIYFLKTHIYYTDRGIVKAQCPCATIYITSAEELVVQENGLVYTHRKKAFIFIFVIRAEPRSLLFSRQYHLFEDGDGGSDDNVCLNTLTLIGFAFVIVFIFFRMNSNLIKETCLCAKNIMVIFLKRIRHLLQSTVYRRGGEPMARVPKMAR
jgi:hypothetical protein